MYLTCACVHDNYHVATLVGLISKSVHVCYMPNTNICVQNRSDCMHVHEVSDKAIGHDSCDTLYVRNSGLNLEDWICTVKMTIKFIKVATIVIMTN